MRTRLPTFAVFVACFVCAVFLNGCDKPIAPGKSTLEKLNSPDVVEQEQGLAEAEDKYGAKQ